MSSTADKLRQARTLIEDQARWCQGSMSMGGDDGTRRRCAMSALYPVLGDYSIYKPILALKGAAKELYGQSVFHVNDILGHDAVMRMYDRAIEMAEEAGWED